MDEDEIRGLIARVDQALQDEDIMGAGEFLTELEIGAGADPGLRRNAALAAVRFLKAVPVVPTNDGPLTPAPRMVAIRLAIAGLATEGSPDEAADARELALVHVAAALGERQPGGGEDKGLLQVESHLRKAKEAADRALTAAPTDTGTSWVTDVVQQAEVVYRARGGDWDTFDQLLRKLGDTVARHEWLRTRVAMEAHLYAGDDHLKSVRKLKLFELLYLTPEAGREWTAALAATEGEDARTWDLKAAQGHFQRVVETERPCKLDRIEAHIGGYLEFLGIKLSLSPGKDDVGIHLRLAELHMRFASTWTDWMRFGHTATAVITKGPETIPASYSWAELWAKALVACQAAVKAGEAEAERKPEHARPHALLARLYWELLLNLHLVADVKAASAEAQAEGVSWPAFDEDIGAQLSRLTLNHARQAISMGTGEERDQLKPIIGPIVTSNPEAYADLYKGKGCFIATATCGSPDAVEVRVLQELRDTILARSGLGRAVMAAYYGLSPSLAKPLRESSTLRLLSLKLLVEPAARIATRLLGSSGARHPRRLGDRE